MSILMDVIDEIYKMKKHEPKHDKYMVQQFYYIDPFQLG